MAPAWVAAVALGATSSASAGEADFSIVSLEVNQAVQTGTTPLLGQRATFVRARVRLVGSDGPLPVDGILRVFVDGQELPASPLFSQNGPFNAKPTPNMGLLDDTLNFIFLPPASGNVVLVAEVNPLGPNHVPELTAANNTFTSAPLNFQARNVPEIAYAPIDYRPSGGPTPNLPPEGLIIPGVGDNFVQGIYPASDFFYHRTDAPSKLWTSSLGSSGSPLLNSLAVDIELMSPRPDFLYGWVPGGLSYNGQAVISGPVSMGNTQNIRHQRTFAHELGHNHGLFHNTTTTNLFGIDVEHHLAITELLPQLKASSLKDIMYAGLLTHEAWVASGNYAFFFNHPVYVPNDADFAATHEGPVLMLTGLWDRANGVLSLQDTLELPSAELTVPAGVDETALVVRAYADGVLVHELPLAVRDSLDTCPECRNDAVPAHDDAAQPDATAPTHGAGHDDASGDSAGTLTTIGFQAKIPAVVDGRPVDRVTVDVRQGASLLIERARSASAPEAAFVTPLDVVAPGSALNVAWTATDADGDALLAYLSYSPDGVRRVPLATGVGATSHSVDLATLPAFVDGRGFFELRVSDGLRTTTTTSASLRLPPSGYAGGPVGNAPWIEVITPDTGRSFLQGATVVLHSSGWDLEDRHITGDSIVWTSDVDGALGTGRLLSTSTLAPGVHTLAATATDSDGNVTVATSVVTIVARGLPDVGEVCQTDLGFGGPGTSVFSVCGDELASGGSADLLLTGAPANVPAFLVLGFTQGAAPMLGGTLVPFPIDVLVAVMTDGDGRVSVPGIQGGGGPVTVYAQFLVDDAGQAGGWGFSNALEVEYLP